MYFCVGIYWVRYMYLLCKYLWKCWCIAINYIMGDTILNYTCLTLMIGWCTSFANISYIHMWIVSDIYEVEFVILFNSHGLDMRLCGSGLWSSEIFDLVRSSIFRQVEIYLEKNPLKYVSLVCCASCCCGYIISLVDRYSNSEVIS